MRCPSCGHENPEVARLCLDCGTSLYINCPSCGQENFADRSLCTNCWTQLREEEPVGFGEGRVFPAFEMGRPAGFWVRFLASFIDGIPLFLVSALFSWLLLGENLFDSLMPSTETAPDGTVTATGGGFTAGQGLNLVLSAIYATALVSMLGGTVGVLLFRMRILRPDGTMLGPGRAFARYVVLTATFALFLIPAIVSAFMVGLRSDRRGIHDLICDTVVIIRGDAPPGR
ncbi:MAG: RDD family protein [Chloroflexi bacterium]|nr:RDD family protein [Chloroflexota bacterium]